MLRNAGLALLVLIPVLGVTQGPELRDLYNQMYPVDSLKRDAFALCHESDPTFIRAVRDDRESCFGRMPHSIALAIGYARSPTALAANQRTDPAAQAAHLLREAAALTRQPLRPVLAFTAPARLGPTPAGLAGDPLALAALLPAAWAVPPYRGERAPPASAAMVPVAGVCAIPAAT